MIRLQSLRTCMRILKWFLIKRTFDKIAIFKNIYLILVLISQIIWKEIAHFNLLLFCPIFASNIAISFIMSSLGTLLYAWYMGISALNPVLKNNGNWRRNRRKTVGKLRKKNINEFAQKMWTDFFQLNLIFN